jgi:hypothetical protein
MTRETKQFSSPPQVPGPRGWPRIFAVASLCTLMATGWMFRWQVIEPHQTGDTPGYAYMVNRWTGEIRYLQDAQWISVVELKR